MSPNYLLYCLGLKLSCVHRENTALIPNILKDAEQIRKTTSLIPSIAENTGQIRQLLEVVVRRVGELEQNSDITYREAQDQLAETLPDTLDSTPWRKISHSSCHPNGPLMQEPS